MEFPADKSPDSRQERNGELDSVYDATDVEREHTDPVDGRPLAERILPEVHDSRLDSVVNASDVANLDDPQELESVEDQDQDEDLAGNEQPESDRIAQIDGIAERVRHALRFKHFQEADCEDLAQQLRIWLWQHPEEPLLSPLRFFLIVAVRLKSRKKCLEKNNVLNFEGEDLDANVQRRVRVTQIFEKIVSKLGGAVSEADFTVFRFRFLSLGSRLPRASEIAPLVGKSETAVFQALVRCYQALKAMPIAEFETSWEEIFWLGFSPNSEERAALEDVDAE